MLAKSKMKKRVQANYLKIYDWSLNGEVYIRLNKYYKDKDKRDDAALNNGQTI